MLFNSLPFLYFFLPITYWVFWKLEDKNRRYLWLTLSGYVFYGAWNYKFCFLMAFSTVVSYAAGLGFLRWNDARHRKLFLVLPVVCDLLLLGFFKYANFTLANAGWLASILGSHWRPPRFDIVLPVGISFYTFHTITYIVDSYRNVIKPTRNFFEFSCYVSLFSQLVAGPIVRFRQVESDLENIDHVDRHTYMDRGWSFFVIGIIKKVLLADTIAAVINPALSHWQTLTTADAWLCALGYTYQLYFDFSGYSDMAVGLGSFWNPPAAEFRHAVQSGQPVGFLAALAHFAFLGFAGLSLHSARRQQEGNAPNVSQPNDHDAAGRTLARGELDVRGMGRVSRPMVVHQSAF